MTLLDRIFAGDEELGKKDDDHRPGKGVMLPSSWSPRQTIPPFRRRRYFYGVVAIVFIFLFIKNIPTDLGSNSQRGDSRVPRRNTLATSRPTPPAGEPPRPKESSEAQTYYYDGPIRFYKLAVSLHAVAGLVGYDGANKNVLFAASGLKSASELIPLACEMAKRERNDVHFALMGRDDLEIPEIKKLNGVSSDCNVHWHDARPDYSRWSSNWRMEVSVGASLGHMQTFVHPQVIITDHASREDTFFIKAVKAKAVAIDKSVIELPLDAAENFMWITRLDSGSLAAWHTTFVDIVIHVPPHSSGSLLRLLKSIEGADYFGSRRPHITIELPAEIDPPTSDFLEDFVWPPLDPSGAPHASQVTLRHRIPRHSFNAQGASSHLVESFYPARPKDSHVLLITPQAELSPVYYHYVMYNLLEYKYSTSGQRSPESKNLMGFSLELPRLYLNDSQYFDPPMLEHDDHKVSFRKALEPTQFLWQAPNSNAALYFGEKWVELHSFLSARISLQDPRVPAKQRAPTREKLISTSYPSWMEYVQELMRAREYSLLYPNFPDTEDAIVTIHEEHHQRPEEYFQRKSRSNPAPVPTLDPNDPFTTDPSDFAAIIPVQSEPPLLVSNLISLLPYAGDLPELTDLPMLSHDGNPLSRSTSTSAARNFADELRSEIGRCGVKAKLIIEPMSARDLFCNLEEVEGMLNLDLEEDDGNDDNIDTRDTEKAKEKDDEDIEENSEERAPAKGEEIKQKQTPLKDKIADKDGQVQNEFSAHLQRQGGKLAHDKTKISETRHGGGGGDAKGIREGAREEPKQKVGSTTSEEGEKQKDNKKKSESGATRKENTKDEEKSTESAKKQEEKQPDKGSRQVARAKVGGGVKDGDEQPATKDTTDKAAKKPSEVSSKEEVAGTKKENSKSAENLGKQREKPDAEVVRDRGW